MKSIRLENIKKAYDGEKILDNLSLTIPAGQIFALLGPSGCGKTTLLRLIGGFEQVNGGKIFLGDEEITNLPSNKRHINTVFQNYALFPHLSVFDNVAYSQKIKGFPRAVVREKVMKVLRTVHLEQLATKYIDQLSGGQKQRVALARAIINEPDVLLLDEPLTALDLKLREKVLIELIDLQSKLQTTFVYVTHDQFEALTVADQMAIMNHDGEIEQIGTPKEIYEFPVSIFVAKFVGTTNILKGTYHADPVPSIVIPDLGTFQVSVPETKVVFEGKPIYISLRPEKVWISIGETPGFSNHLTGVVESIVYQGRSTQYNVRLKNDQLLSAFEQNEEHFPRQVIDYGSTVNLYWQKENVVLLEK